MKKIPRGTWFHYDHFFDSSHIRLELLELIQIGEICLAPGAEVGAHPQRCHEISYIVSGTGTFLQDGAEVHVQAGDIVITPSTGIHIIRAAQEESLSFAYTGFNFLEDRFPDRALVAAFQKTDQLHCQDCGDTYFYFRKCIDEFYRESGGSRLIVEACLLQIIVWSYRSLTSPPQPPEYTSTGQLSGHLIHRIKRYVEENITLPLSITGIADALGYSPYYISHLFREKTGQTLQEYITSRKIDKAQELIQLNRYSFTEIAEKLGYLNLQTFSRVFRKETGLSPSAYLKSL